MEEWVRYRSRTKSSNSAIRIDASTLFVIVNTRYDYNLRQILLLSKFCQSIWGKHYLKYAAFAQHVWHFFVVCFDKGVVFTIVLYCAFEFRRKSQKVIFLGIDDADGQSQRVKS